MFRFLGRMVRRGWFFLLAGWIVLVFALGRAAPPWEAVAQDRQFSLLPPNSPSRRGQEAFARAFPDDEKHASNIVLVLHRREAGDLQRDLTFIEDVVEPVLRQIADADGGLADEVVPSDVPLFGNEDQSAPPPPPRRSVMARIHTPNAPGAGALLVSPDRKALLVVIDLTTEFTSHENWPTITRILDMVRDLKQQGKVPEGTVISVTGSAVLGRDHSLAELQSARATGTLTVILVVVLLVLMYRAPLLALIPLVTVFLAVRIALNVLALLAAHGYLAVFQGIEIYITILAYGAGVDYSLFLTARYKEELDRGSRPDDALADTVGGVGGALTASAATVICGIAMMTFAQFSKFHDAGIAIPLSLSLVVLATLTFSPALLHLVGRWAFWPRRAGAEKSHPPPPQGWRAWLDGSALQRAWDRVGRGLLRRPGRVWLGTVAVMAPFVLVGGLLYNRLSYDMIGDLPANATSVAGTRALQDHFPAGLLGTTTTLLVNPKIDFGSTQGRDVVSRITEDLNRHKEELGLADVRSLTAPLGTANPAGLMVSGHRENNEVSRKAERRLVREHYLTDMGERGKIGTRLELVLSVSPFSHGSMEDLGRIEQTIRAIMPAHTDLYVVGTTASVRDLADVMRHDRTRIELLVLVSVFVILIVLLRRLVVPIYLVLSVLFSYYATLGATFLLFWALDPHGFIGIDWKVAIFLFTILIAVGEDYNIFLMARVREEEERFGTPRGIIEALSRTGPIISSCGIIMAGTFASLLAGSLAEMKQLGFALAFGVLLDTFIVRPILVPTFLILLRTGRLSPRGWSKKAPPGRAETSPVERTPSSS